MNEFKTIQDFICQAIGYLSGFNVFHCKVEIFNAICALNTANDELSKFVAADIEQDNNKLLLDSDKK